MVAATGDDVQVQEFRVSFIWTESVMAALTGEADPANLPRPEAIDRDAYATRFDTPSPDGGRTVPWPTYNDQGFWEQYLETDQLGLVSGQQAYRSLVPLRISPGLQLTPPIPDSNASCEGLVYPWGIAAIVTVRCRHPWTDLEEPVRAALQIRREARFGTGDETSKELRLDEVARDCLDALRRDTFGDLPGRRGPTEPFTVFTVVRGTGERANMSPAEEPVARLLHGVTSFADSWSSDVVPKLEDVTVAGRRTRPADHVIYGRRRGRAIWAPDSFTRSDAPKHSLGCQHRNLVLASAQLESLGTFALATADRLREQADPLLSTHRMLAKRAVGAIGRAYVGHGTYRSGSLRSQIKDNDWLADVNYVRQEVDLDPITP